MPEWDRLGGYNQCCSGCALNVAGIQEMSLRHERLNMAILPEAKLSRAARLSRFGYTNPFLPERIELERSVLGRRFVRSAAFIQYRPDAAVEDMFPNAEALRELTENLLDQMRARLLDGYSANETELCVYEDLAMYALYARYMSQFAQVPIERYPLRPEREIVDAYTQYTHSYRHYFELPGQRFPSSLNGDVVFAGLFQIERAFFHVFRYILGSSLQAATLRAMVWQSIFTHDMRRYSRGLYRVMGNIPTLVTGPSGTGKELVARAIAYSQFIEFDSDRGQFAADFTSCFHGLNLSALPQELIESELFGHVKGAFTGANRDRAGFLDEMSCSRWGTVFLDEIGELDCPDSGQAAACFAGTRIRASG